MRKILTDHPNGNLAVNRATCDNFIKRSREGFPYPCVMCPQRKKVNSIDYWDPILVCPCGAEAIDIEESPV